MQTIMIVEDDPDIWDGVRIALDCNRVRSSVSSFSSSPGCIGR